MSPSASKPGLVETLVQNCRLRIASQIRKQECFLALALAMLGVCGLLLLGTRYVPVVMLPLTASLGAWVAFKRWKLSVPDEYFVARQIDDREELSDELATAYYFRARGDGVFSRRVADSQYEVASETARSVDPERVFPNALAPSQRVSVYCLASAALLFGLRVGVQSKLSFEPPLAPLLLESLFGYQPQTRGADQSRAAQIDQGQVPDESLTEEDFREQLAAASETNEQGLPDEESEDPARDADKLPEVEGLITVPLEEQVAEDSLRESSTQTEQGSDGSAGDESADLPSDPDVDSWNEDTQSLLDKLKQAFENMLQTLDMASVESANSETGQEQGSGSTEESASAGEPADSGSADEQMSTQAADASMEGGEPGPEAGETASAGSTTGEDSSGDQSSGENASAAGTSDGSKEFVEAEQLDVLGDLEALYMERAERMKGDVTVETRLAEQSASVPYNQRSTSHADQGGAISRDEIPPAYRSYIQNYFETLRRNSE
jgi:hypothetical protein